MAGSKEPRSDDDTPLRPAASPRPTPPSSQSSFGFRLSIDEPDNEPRTPSSGAQSPARGRSLHRVPAHSRLVSLFLTRRRTSFDAVDFGRKQRLLSRDFTDTPAEYDESFLEPPTLERFRSSLSEEIYRTATFDNSIDISKFGGHRDTFALLGFRKPQHRRVGLSASFLSQILQYLDFDTYKAVRLCCRSWSVSITAARPIAFPPVVLLPTEILEKIYFGLPPIDFNAARHASRSWMIASLEERLLISMLKRGGWLGASRADNVVQVKLREQLNDERRQSIVDEYWFLSKRLATECSLGPGWTGNGTRNVQPSTTGLQLASDIDFNELGEGPSLLAKDQSRKAPQFTISVCSRFLLAFEECTIYVFALQRTAWDANTQPYGGHLEMLTSVICPSRVLAVSMDTSSQRYAVAALLQGSMGLVSDVDLMGYSSPDLPPISMRKRSGRYDDGQGSVFIPPLSEERIARKPPLYTEAKFGTVYTAPSDRAQARIIAEATLPEIRGALQSPRLWTIGDGTDQPPPIQTSVYTYSLSNFRAETGSRAIYRNLCSTDDPPISVAICPQRRCVAFGCRDAIELHWTDALTGQDLHRRFPLTAPSDFLYFMPARAGTDSAKKLCILSSTFHPDIVDQGDEGAAVRGENRSLNDFVDDTYTNLRSRGMPDHYQAVPLSDGHHVLFTQPKAGELCLGWEGLRGVGWRELMSNFVFTGPKTSGNKNVVPHVYAAAAELQWGVRIAAAFKDQLWLFLIPPDLFLETEIVCANSKPCHIQEYQPVPIRIEGTQVANIADIASLTIDASAGDLTIWAFASNGKASVFQLAGSGSKAVIQRAALSNGIIRFIRDADGDTVMEDAPQDHSTSQVIHSDSTTAHRPYSPTSLRCSPELLAVKDCNEMNSPEDYFRGPETSTPPSYSTTPPLPPSFPPPPLVDDEGYASAGDDEFELAGGGSAIYIPPLWARWSEEGDAEWVPEYLCEGGETEDQGLGLDILELCRCECELVGC